MYLKKLLLILLLNFLGAGFVNAEGRITLGAKILAAGWQGDNGSGGSSFESDEGGQFALSAAYALNKFYTAISLQGGDYTFSGTAPDQFTQSGRVNVGNTKIEHREIDVIAGYYFWDNISLFADLKEVNSVWKNNNYEQSFGGLGFGASGFIPLKNDFTLFGSIGFVGKGDIEDAANVKVGEGSSSALEFGAVYKLAENSSINFGLKFRAYDFEYLDKTKQEYDINALFFGYNHNFTL
jgi:hypothetical protein